MFTNSKGLTVAMTALLLTSIAQTAHADWSGTFAGGSLGLGIFDNEVFDSNENVAYGFSNLDGFAGAASVHVGHNIQNGSFVYGGILSLGVASYDESYETTYCGPAIHSASINSIASLRGRAGLASDNALIYLTAGVAQISTDEVFECNEDNEDFLNDSYTAIVGGVGAELMLQDNLTLGLEYLIYDADDAEQDQFDDPNDGDIATFDFGAQTFSLTVNYFFN